MSLCEGEGEGIDKEALCAHRIGEKMVAQKHTCRQKGKRGPKIQNLTS